MDIRECDDNWGCDDEKEDNEKDPPSRASKNLSHINWKKL